MTGKAKKCFGRFFVYLVLSVASFLSVFPLYWSFISAFNNSAQILGGRLLPSTYLMSNLRELFTLHDVWGAMKNSVVNSAVLTLGSLAVCSLAGYGFEIYHDKAKDRVMAVLMLAMMVPFVALLVPLFQMFSKWNMVNTAPAFVLPTLATPFLIMFFRNSARAFPKDIIEAARIDSLNEVQIFLRMFVPTMRPTYAAAATITFMSAWNAYLWPKVILQHSITMPMLVANSMGGYVVNYGMVMVSVTLCSLPTVVVFFVLQKSFTEAIAGTVK